MHLAPARSACRAALAAALLALAAPAPAAITIGPGPALGTDRAGVTWHQEFQDWGRADLKALDRAGLADSRYVYNDGLDDSRDLVAFYSREENDKVYFRADLFDLALGAETSGLNLYLAIDCAPGGQPWLPDFVNAQTDHPWELVLCLYQSGTAYGTDYRIYDAGFNNVTGGYLGSYWNSQLDAVEFGVDRQLLVNAGWNGSSPIHFQPFTTKDGAGSSCPGGSKIADAFTDFDRGCSDGVLNGTFTSADAGGVVWYASIAHGNQSINRAGDIGAHIYDPQSATGIAGGTGFLRTLDTHELFKVPLNIHPSGTLTSACLWARKPGGAADPQDGPAFLARIREFVDANQAVSPGSLIGGVFAEHILPYFEGAVNAASFALTDSLNQAVYGVSAQDARVMHVPERVIRSTNTGLAPLTGHTFADIAASPYEATVLDEIRHLHRWFYPGEDCATDQAYRNKVHKVNGVHCFAINDREDQGKFGNHDGGMVLDARFSLLQKAIDGASSRIVVVFDDWEALAGKSFDPVGGNIVPNNNPNQYHATIRWAANHPWIQVSNLKDLLAMALADPAAFVVDHGTRYDLPLESYEYLMHSTEDSYDNWYYGNSGGVPAPEQDFYSLVPVLTGPQGDYHLRGVGPGSDGPPLPSGKANGDMNTPGTLIHDTWAALQAAPAGAIRDVGVASFLAMIYETAWHEEDNSNYANDCYGPWQYPDLSWDGLNTWALRLSNHVRGAAMYAAAAQWADSAAQGHFQGGTLRYARDLDLDGESEYVLANARVYAVFERWGGRCVLACAVNPATGRQAVLIGPGVTNPSSPGEEELANPFANRCSGFKVMNGGGYADVANVVTPFDPIVIPEDPASGWRFRSPDGQSEWVVTLRARGSSLLGQFVGGMPTPVYVRFGLSPNPLDLAFHGHANLQSSFPTSTSYRLVNASGGFVELDWESGTSFVPSPANAGPDRRNLALTEEVELLLGAGALTVELRLGPDTSPPAVAVDDRPLAPAAFALRGPWPSPARGGAVRFRIALPEAADVAWRVVDVAGRAVAGGALGRRAAGEHEVAIGRDEAPLAPGLYFVRVTAGGRTATARWAVIR